MLLKSAGNNAIYRTEGFSRYAAFLHYSFDESRTVYTYSHTCPDGNAPSLLEQTNDGSKFMYSSIEHNEENVENTKRSSLSPIKSILLIIITKWTCEPGILTPMI